jgi:tetratricopeptide (TPR) repeat protein
MLHHYVAPVHRAHIIRFQFDQKITARNFLAQILWLQGFADQALTLNEMNIEEARAFDHTMSLCNALTKGACLVSLMAKDLPAAGRFVEMLLARSARDGLPMWHAWGRCFKGILDIKLGAVDSGLELLRATLAKLPENRFSLRHTWVLGEEADGLRLAGRIAEGRQTIEKALTISERDEEFWCIAELLRIKGELLLAQGVAERAERCFQQAIDWARRQRVISWELRAALSFARLLLRAGRAGEALATIEPIYRQFSEGFATADLQSARTAIEEASRMLHR